jgi:hypothetical protein
MVVEAALVHARFIIVPTHSPEGKLEKCHIGNFPLLDWLRPRIPI